MPRFLTTHTGSLIRPRELAAALTIDPGGRREGYAGPGTFSQALAVGVRDIVRRQAEVGLDIIDNGEMSKTGTIHYSYARMSGMEPRHVTLDESQLQALLPKGVAREALAQQMGFFTPFQPRIGDAYREGTQWVCTGPLVYDDAAIRKDVTDLKDAMSGVHAGDAFLVAVSPGSLYWCRNEYYNSDEEFTFAFAEAMRTEYQHIIDAGFYLQVDDPVMCHNYMAITLLGGTPEDYVKWSEPRIEALNHALRGIPQDRIRYHVCSGSAHGPHAFDPPLPAVIGQVLKVNAGAYLLEFANARHEHEWEMWRDVKLPDDKILVPGLVTHHTEIVEHPELVAERLVRLANVIGPERIIAGTDCGFSSSAIFQRVPEWTQWAKLKALVEGTKMASERLWGARAESA